jgi:MFS family permease
MPPPDDSQDRPALPPVGPIRPPELPAYETDDDGERPATETPTKPMLDTQVPGAIKAVHDPYSAWRFANFRYYITGLLAWAISGHMFNVVLAWHIYEMTNAKSSLALVGLLQVMPVLLLAMVGGVLADRFNRKHLLMGMVSVRGCCLALMGLLSLTQVHVPNLWILEQTNHQLARFVSWMGETQADFNHPALPLMYLLFLVLGTANALGGPARAAMLPSIIPIAHYSNAATWNSSVGQLCSMFGPALGGLLLWIFAANPNGYSYIYFLAAGCLVIYLLLLCMVRYQHTIKAVTQPVIQNMVEGIKFVFQRRLIFAALSLDMFAVLLGGATILLPVYAKDILNVGPMGFGVLRAAPALGAFTMAMVIAHLPPIRKAGPTLLWSVAGFGVATIIFGLSTWFWLSLVALFLTGAFDNISVVIRHTLVQVLTPNDMRGRVSAVNNIFISSSNELGTFRAGLSAAAFGTVAAVAGGGVCTLLVVAIIALVIPEVRRFGSLKDARPLDEK